MSQTTLNVRVDSQLKQQFEDLGITPSTAGNVFIKTQVRECRIPFEIAAPSDPFYCEANIKRLLF